MDSETLQTMGVVIAFAAVIGLVLLIKQQNYNESAHSNLDKDDLLDTGNLMIATQIKIDIGKIRMEIDKLTDSAIRLNESSREILERLRDQAKDEPLNSSEFRMLVRQVLKEFQEFRCAHPDKDYEFLVGRAIKVLSQLTF